MGGSKVQGFKCLLTKDLISVLSIFLVDRSCPFGSIGSQMIVEIS